MDKNANHAAAWRHAFPDGVRKYPGEVHRYQSTRKSVTGRKTIVRNAQPGFVDVPRHLQAENDDVRHEHKLRSLMNCRELNKFSGQHKNMERPAARTRPNMLSLPMAKSYLEAGAELFEDTVKKLRYIRFKNVTVGYVTYGQLVQLMNIIKLDMSRVPGTNLIVYKITKS